MQQEKILLQEHDVVHRRQTGYKTYPGSMDTRDYVRKKQVGNHQGIKMHGRSQGQNDGTLECPEQLVSLSMGKEK